MGLEGIEKLKKHGGNTRLLARSLGMEDGDIIDFSSNINPYGPPPAIINAIRNILNRIGEYPEQEAETFAAEVAAELGVGPENVVAGNGSIELIYLIPRVMNAKKALLLVPSFTEYELSLAKAGAAIIYKKAFTSVEAAAAISNLPPGVDIVMAGNPNNPCGYKLKKSDLLDAVDNNPGTTWVIDEAFIDFTSDCTGTTLVWEAVKRDNLIVLRSLTKIYSIAGLRLGYLVASPAVAKKLRDEKHPWGVNSLAIEAGITALRDDKFVTDSVAKLSGEARRFYFELAGIDGLTPFEPAANYILVKIEAPITSTDMQKALLMKGIAVRDCSSYTGIDDKHFRVAVKRPADNDRLVEELKVILREPELSL